MLPLLYACIELYCYNSCAGCVVVAKQVIILLVNNPHTNSVLTLVLSACRPEDRLTVYYTVFEFYEGGFEKFSQR